MIFIDSTMLVGAGDGGDARHADGKALFERLASGALGVGLVSDFVLDETMTLLGRRRGVGVRRAVAFGRFVLSSPRVRLLCVDPAALQDSLATYERFEGRLSFTDATTVVLMRREGCDTLYSHDGGFDGVPNVVRLQAPS